MKQNISVPLKKYLPDFCYQTAFEILTFLEGIDEDVKPECVKVIVGQLARDGKLLRRYTKTPVPVRTKETHFEYCRNPNWRPKC